MGQTRDDIKKPAIDRGTVGKLNGRRSSNLGLAHPSFASFPHQHPPRRPPQPSPHPQTSTTPAPSTRQQRQGSQTPSRTISTRQHKQIEPTFATVRGSLVPSRPEARPPTAADGARQQGHGFVRSSISGRDGHSDNGNNHSQHRSSLARSPRKVPVGAVSHPIPPTGDGPWSPICKLPDKPDALPSYVLLTQPRAREHASMHAMVANAPTAKRPSFDAFDNTFKPDVKSAGLTFNERQQQATNTRAATGEGGAVSSSAEDTHGGGRGGRGGGGGGGGGGGNSMNKNVVRLLPRRTFHDLPGSVDPIQQLQVTAN